jgi:hypothetical protein
MVKIGNAPLNTSRNPIIGLQWEHEFQLNFRETPLITVKILGDTE